jgi:hypothetical protein
MPPFLPSRGDNQSSNSNIDPPNTQKEVFELFKNEIVNICGDKGGKNDPDWNFEEGAIAYRSDK